MYNLLMKFSGHFNEWEENQGRLYDVSFFAGRIFEHTAPTIQRQFTADGDPDFEVLMKLPCLFTYEGYNVVGSIGRISDVRSRSWQLPNCLHSTQRLPQNPANRSLCL